MIQWDNGKPRWWRCGWGVGLGYARAKMIKLTPTPFNNVSTPPIFFPRIHIQRSPFNQLTHPPNYMHAPPLINKLGQIATLSKHLQGHTACSILHRPSKIVLTMYLCFKYLNRHSDTQPPVILFGWTIGAKMCHLGVISGSLVIVVGTWQVKV